MLRTLNGAECTIGAAGAPHVFAGALLNASAVARAVSDLLKATDLCVTVVACGERRGGAAEEARFAIEDYLGAGAILSAAGAGLSPEARVCAAAFEGSRAHLLQLLLDCASGRELRSLGLEADVYYASQHDVCGKAPALRDGGYSAAPVPVPRGEQRR